MTCDCKHNNPRDYAQCGGYPLRNISDADVVAYAQRSGASDNDQLCAVESYLLTGRLIYWKNMPGDCPTQTKISLGPSAAISKGLGVGLTGVGAASAVGLLATGGAGLGASAAGSGAALGGLPSIFGAIAGPAALVAIPLIIWASISAHHKIAVAREQATICDVSQAYDQWEQTVEAGIASGQIAVSDAKAAVPRVELSLMQALQAIYKSCNAACYFQKGLRALDLYAVEKLYDSLSPRASFWGNPANPAQKIASPASRKLGVYGIAAAGAYGAVKIAGALA